MITNTLRIPTSFLGIKNINASLYSKMKLLSHYITSSQEELEVSENICLKPAAFSLGSSY